jgi:hypothetical protein
MKFENEIQIELLYGLPASGKTTYAQEKCGFLLPFHLQHKNLPVLIDLDDMKKNSKDEKDFLYLLHEKLEVQVLCNRAKQIVIDGLITNNEVAKKIMSSVKEIFPNAEFSITYWEKNVDACLHNDIGRREQNSIITIKHIKYEEPSEELIKEFQVKKVEKKKVVRKPEYQAWAEKMKIWDKGTYDPTSKGKLRSCGWSLGGTSGGYDGSIHQLSPEPQPSSFVRFDDLLLAICPDISFLRYKKIYNECVSVESKSESDWYGGHSSEAWYECDIEKLYNILKEMELIK